MKDWNREQITAIRRLSHNRDFKMFLTKLEQDRKRFIENLTIATALEAIYRAQAKVRYLASLLDDICRITRTEDTRESEPEGRMKIP